MSGPTKAQDQDHAPSAEMAEYVLGLLDAGRHAELTAEIAQSPALRAEEAFWRAHFAGLDDAFEPVEPPAGARRAIEIRLFGTAPGTSFWQSLALWRGAAIAALMMLVAALGLIGFDRLAPPDIPTRYVAALDAEGSAVRFVASFDARAGAVTLAATSGDPVADKDFELWFIKGEDAPVSLGTIALADKVEVTLPPAIAGEMAPGIVLAVSLEPLGGAPGGAPTGPIVAAGALTAI